MKPFHCTCCCGLIGYFKDEAGMLATYGSKCPYCKDDLVKEKPVKEHADAMERREARGLARTFLS